MRELACRANSATVASSRSHAGSRPRTCLTVDAFLAVVHAIIKPLDGKAIAERFDYVIEGDAIFAAVGGIPFERLVLHYARIIGSRFNNPALAA